VPRHPEMWKCVGDRHARLGAVCDSSGSVVGLSHDASRTTTKLNMDSGARAVEIVTGEESAQAP
jgi:hypothetical protein